MDVFREFARRHSGFGGFEDLFSSFMGGGFEGRRAGGAQLRRGEDLRLALPLSLEEIAHGVEKQVRLKRQVSCPTCGGSGAKAGGRSVRCTQCDGSGEIKIIQRVLWGQVIRTEPCRRCDGEGTLVEDPCPDCGGDGRHEEEEQISLKIPRGVADGERLAKRGAGNAGRRGGPPGDLIVEIHERVHEIFERRGLDLVVGLPVSFSQAALGMRYTLPTLEDTVEVKVPAGIQSGKVLRLRGRGLSSGNQRGDLFVVIQVWTPQKLTKQERELLEQLGEQPGMRAPRPGKGLFEKFKDAFRG
jgi:molecular chaperone DnaJ